MNNKVYDILKWCAILLLPALAVFIAKIFSIWGLPYGQEIENTIRAISLFLGAILGVSSVRYNAKEKED